jgi:hypothetical protein
LTIGGLCFDHLDQPVDQVYSEASWLLKWRLLNTTREAFSLTVVGTLASRKVLDQRIAVLEVLYGLVASSALEVAAL